jgi:hypothetical protein
MQMKILDRLSGGKHFKNFEAKIVLVFIVQSSQALRSSVFILRPVVALAA